MGVRAGIRFVLRITYSDTIINYRSCQKLKLIGIGEFNHLMNMLAFFFMSYLFTWIYLKCSSQELKA